MHHVWSSRTITRCLGLALLLPATACSDGDPVAPVGDAYGTITVDARTDWAFVDLGSTAAEVQVSDPSSSSAWDIAFLASSVMLNGGAAGPGGVEGFCLCQNADATDEQLLTMTAETELAAFEAVTTSDLPTDETAWESDELAPAIDGWWSYDMTTHTVTPATDRTWIVRTAEGDAFAKLRVTAIANGTQQHAGDVTLEFATQAAAGEPYGETQTLTVDLSGGAVHVDLLDGAVADATDWDLRLDGYDIRLNSGVSGTGDAGAIEAGEEFDAVGDGGAVPSNVFKRDEFGGVFDAHPWYRYNLEGNHQIWPNYNVYLIRTGGQVYKVQLTSYYNPADGLYRHISLRYAPLAD